MAHPRRFARGTGILACGILLPLLASRLAFAQFVNDPTGEPASAHQSYPSLAELNGVIVAAFADFRTGEANRIRCSYSVDTGATWIQLGVPPVWGSSHWVIDPRVVASPVHGKFFVFGGANDYPLFGAIFVCVPLSFPGGVPTWGTPRLVRVTRPDSWLTTLWGHDAAASPLTGRLFAVSNFDNQTGTPTLDLQYSDDEGQTWSTPVPLDSLGTAPILRVYGDRLFLMNSRWNPAYLAITTATDPGSWWTFSRLPRGPRAMTPGIGPSGAENTFDIDEKSGAYEGRIFAVWTESYVYEDDPVPDPLTEAGPATEVEPNDDFAAATPAAVGNVLRGAPAASGTDEDHFVLHLTIGQRVILWADSLGAGTSSLSLRVADALGTRLRWQTSVPPAGGKYTFVATRTDDYDLRVIGKFTGGVSPGYRIRTAEGFTSGEPAVDQCDLVTAYSDNHGATWSAPVRASATPAGAWDDGPVLEVGHDHRPQIGYWGRTSTGGTADARWRLMRSNDGGASWQLGARLTTTPDGTTWESFSGTVLTMNAMLALPDRFVHAFTELEPTSPLNTDIRAAVQPMGLHVISCGAEYAGHPGDAIHPGAMLQNDDPYFTEPIRYVASVDRDWPVVVADASVPIGPGAAVLFQMTIPDTAAAGDVAFNYVAVRFNNEGIVSCPTTIHVEANAAVEDGFPFAATRVWPNPAAGATRLSFTLERPDWVTLDVLDVHGRRVARLANQILGIGAHELAWNGLSARGRPVAAGVYLMDLRAGDRHEVFRIVRMD